jgi:pyruvate ferredoxin oxidoreductase alpha subunit
MLKQIECSRAIAEAVGLCRPEVICAYPITPQTHIVEGLSELVRYGQVPRCEFINVESEFSALSVAIGASATGARTYTATASQGLLFMAEAVYNAAGLGLPIVMTLGTRAIGAPINIWNDHSDAMSMKDAGWIQLFAKDAQEAVDLHILAFRLAEELSVPVMVCVDGFVLTHSMEQVDLAEQAQVDAFLPAYQPVQLLDPADPVTIGAMVGPEAFAEVRYLAHHKQLQALERIPQLAAEFETHFGRRAGATVQPYRTDGAHTVVVSMGSVAGTIEVVVDDLRSGGAALGAVALGAFRPFPLEALAQAIGDAERVVVVERNLAPGLGGAMASNVRMALRGKAIPVYTVVAGLGGRPVTRASLGRVFAQAMADTLEDLHFLDLDWDAVDRELGRWNEKRRSGPSAENMLRAKRRSRGGTP